MYACPLCDVTTHTPPLHPHTLTLTASLSQTARNMADVHFYVPMKGFAESLNVSAFCAYLCGQLATSAVLNVTRMHAGLSELERNRILLTWLARTMPDVAAKRLAEGGVPEAAIAAGAGGGGEGGGGLPLWDQIAGFTTQP